MEITQAKIGRRIKKAENMIYAPFAGAAAGAGGAVFDSTPSGMRDSAPRGGYETPGWRRAQQAASTRGNTRPPDIEGRAFQVAVETPGIPVLSHAALPFVSRCTDR